MQHEPQGLEPSASGRKRPSGAWLLVAVPALITGLIVWQVRSIKAMPIGELDKGLVETYCQLIAGERYAEAYAQCLSKAYRKEVPLEKFAQAQARAREKRGLLQSRELLRHDASRNLFSGVRTFHFLYRLDYDKGERRDYIVLDNADGEWRIEGTYTMPVETLDFEVW